MPHLIVDYSANLEAEIDMSAFCDHLREAAVAIDAFPSAGVRVRAMPAPHYSIADGSPETMRDRRGRRYADLATAFRYRSSYDKSCQCRPAYLWLGKRTFTRSVIRSADLGRAAGRDTRRHERHV